MQWCSCARKTEGTLYNLVGFQTNLKFGEQKRVFSMIPGLAHAEFMRYGVMHRNSFLNSPRLLTDTYCMRTNPDLYFAGQITGVEGYMESAGSGLVAGLNMVRAVQGKPPLHLPRETMLGALAAHVSDSYNEKYQHGGEYGDPAGAAGADPGQESKIHGAGTAGHAGTGGIADGGCGADWNGMGCLTR